MIRFTRVAKTYASGVPAIEDVSFHLTRGEFAFLTGPSGAGSASSSRTSGSSRTARRRRTSPSPLR